VIHGADETLNQVKTSGKDNYSQADISVPESRVVWVGASADTCFSANAAVAEHCSRWQIKAG